jgi:FlaA1/EpsC-like NDP-sugar epimerase
VRSPFNRHALWQIAADAAIIATSWYLAWMLRFDQGLPVYYDRYLNWQIILIVVGIQLTVFGLAGFYNRWWRYVSTRDMWTALRGVALASLATFLIFTLFEFHPARVPKGVWFIDLLLCLFFVAGSRLLARTLIERPLPGQVVARGKEAVIVGAGDAAQLVIKEMLRNPSLGYTPIAIVDDDPRKRNLRLHGVRVVGTTADLPQVIRDRRPDEVLIAMPTASGEVRGRIVRAAQASGLTVKTLPGLTELVSGDSGLTTQLRPVQVEDVLGREPVEVDLDSIAGYVSAEVVMVTGAGGSIGSELCRQLSRLGPARLVLVDHSEPALFEVDRELARERGFLAGVPVVADVKDGVKMRQVFAKYRPGVVFHAAAYKHVAMMEANPIEAVRNNTLGTRTMADVAVEFGAKRFVLVSTDKAANPRTIMGQSKALCEWIVETWGHRSDVSTRFVAVRFGNVLGSSGSVIPIFRRQIAKGGPVTVTHPEMTRFFMTIPEAVQLVVQAGAIAERGQVYVLDMGEPVRIMDLAENMIRLSGKEPGIEIPIEVIGPAPGEKLHEVLVGDGEVVSPSPHPKIERISRPPVEAPWLDDELAILERLVEEGDTLELVGALNRIVRDPKRVAVAAPWSGPSVVSEASERTGTSERGEASASPLG